MGYGWGYSSGGGCGSRDRAGDAPVAVAALVQTQLQICSSNSPRCVQQRWEQAQGWGQHSTHSSALRSKPLRVQPSILRTPGSMQLGMHCMQLVSSPRLSILEGNPFNCSCGIRWLQLWQNGSRAELGNQSLVCWEGSALVALGSHLLYGCGRWYRGTQTQP